MQITVTPEALREIADDLEREGPNYCRTLRTDGGEDIDLVAPAWQGTGFDAPLDAEHTALEREIEAESETPCPACGVTISHCQGHGMIGDPMGAVLLAQHDDGIHKQCHQDSECKS